MIIRCGENLYQALSQSSENLYSSSEYIPFDICLPSLPSVFLNQKEKHFHKPSTVSVQVSKENLLNFFFYSQKIKEKRNKKKKKSAYFQSL